jgi:hypothetical protein
LDKFEPLLDAHNLPRVVNNRGLLRSNCSAQHDPALTRLYSDQVRRCAVVGTLESKIVAAMHQERRQKADFPQNLSQEAYSTPSYQGAENVSRHGRSIRFHSRLAAQFKMCAPFLHKTATKDQTNNKQINGTNK